MSPSIRMKMLSDHSLFVFTSSFNSHVKRKVCLLTVYVKVWICQWVKGWVFCGTFFPKIRFLYLKESTWKTNLTWGVSEMKVFGISISPQNDPAEKRENMKGTGVSLWQTDRRRGRSAWSNATDRTDWLPDPHTSVSVMSSGGQRRDFTLTVQRLMERIEFISKESECIEVMPFPKFRAWMSCDTLYSIMWFTRLSCHLSSAYRFNSTEYYIRSWLFLSNGGDVREAEACISELCTVTEEEGFLFPFSCNNWSSYLKLFRWEKSAMEWNIEFYPG